MTKSKQKSETQKMKNKSRLFGQQTHFAAHLIGGKIKSLPLVWFVARAAALSFDEPVVALQQPPGFFYL